MPSEIVLFARALVMLPPEERVTISRSLINEAALAEEYRQKHGQVHPAYGDGSLVARLMKGKLPPLRFADDPEFLTSLKIAADAILDHTAQRSTFGPLE
jgi:hypothetical protein